MEHSWVMQTKCQLQLSAGHRAPQFDARAWTNSSHIDNQEEENETQLVCVPLGMHSTTLSRYTIPTSVPSHLSSLLSLAT